MFFLLHIIPFTVYQCLLLHKVTLQVINYINVLFLLKML
jgi:hypothetical protein